MTARNIKLGERPTLFQRVLLMAGGFDPFAQHHKDIVLALSEIPDVNRIVIYPVGPYRDPNSGFPEKNPLASIQHRVAMCRLGTQGIDRIEVDDYDARILGFTSTWDQLIRYSSTPRRDCFALFGPMLLMPVLVRDVWLVIGADNVQYIKTWNDGSELWNNARFIIVSRPGEAPTELPKNYRSLKLNLTGNSKNIRPHIANGDAWEHLVPPDVAEYIKLNGLYGHH